MMQNGTIASARTLTESQKMFDRVDEVLNTDGKPTKPGIASQAAWAPIRQASDGTWIDLYNDETSERDHLDSRPPDIRTLCNLCYSLERIGKLYL